MPNYRVLLLIGLCSTFSLGRAEDWREAAEQRNLNAGQIQELAQYKLLAMQGGDRQIFNPYLEPDMPVFITSDSILNAYHVLFEESVLRMEQANSVKLPVILRRIWRHLDTADQRIQGNAALLAAAKRRAQIVLGTARQLLEDVPLETDAQTAALISAEVDRVTAAVATARPEWLGPEVDPSLLEIDYSRYRPRGFYDRIEGLSRYFRAVSWLQSIPFRVDNDEQLLAVIMLGGGLTEPSLAGDEAQRDECVAFFECFRELLGDRDDWDLLTAASVAPPEGRLDLDSGGLTQIRQALEAKAKATGHRSRINDQIAYPWDEKPLSLRVVSAHRTPEAMLFQQTIDIDRPFPSGLEVAIALGSDYAKRRFEDPAKEEILDTIAESGGLFEGSSLYFDYLDCISALLDAPPRNAPAFLSGNRWQAKSCQTALAGWAQLRHTWSLQAKENFSVKLGQEWEPPVGFVEPDPDFFARLEALSQRTGSLLERVGGEFNSDFNAIARLQRLLGILEAKVASGEGLDEWARTGDVFADQTLRNVTGEYPSKMDPEAEQEFLEHALAETKTVLGQIQRGELSGDKYAGYGHWLWEQPIGQLWGKLAELSGRLRVLAEKQLNNERFNEEERDFIVNYGRYLGPLLFHIPSPSATPRDDVPRIIDVVFDPDDRVCLEVAVGRPRIIYVLYPTEQGEVLCRGAVLPYYEFRSPKRLTDAEWKQLLDSPDAPAQPEWVTSFGPEIESSAPGTAWYASSWVNRIAVLAGTAGVIIFLRWLTKRRNRIKPAT